MNATKSHAVVSRTVVRPAMHAAPVVQRTGRRVSIRVWEEARDRADKIIKLIDTQARPVGEEIVGFAKADFDKLKLWCDEYKAKRADTNADTVGKSNKSNGRRRWHQTDVSSDDASQTPIDVEAN